MKNFPLLLMSMILKAVNAFSTLLFDVFESFADFVDRQCLHNSFIGKCFDESESVVSAFVESFREPCKVIVAPLATIVGFTLILVLFILGVTSLIVKTIYKSARWVVRKVYR